MISSDLRWGIGLHFLRFAVCKAHSEETVLAKSEVSGFVDIHTHILPGIDDGAKSMDEAMQMLRMAWEDGTRMLILTPHYRGRFKETTPEKLREAYAALCRTAQQELPKLRLFLGSEVFYEEDAPQALEAGRILTLADSDFVLLEFRSGAFRSQILSAVSEVIRYGYTPILAHIDRYNAFLSDDALIDEVLDMGAQVQLNANSVMGENGFKVKRFCHALLRREKVQFIASDAHDTKHRPPRLQACYLRVRDKYGSDYAQQVFCYNTRAILEK